MKMFAVYIMTNKSGTLYTGMTNDLMRRVFQHRQRKTLGFTKKYRITKLIYYEYTEDVRAAIGREKEIKGWRRSKKIALIKSVNPRWNDLSEGWYEGLND